MLEVSIFVLLLLITYDSYKFIPKYFFLRFRGYACEGEIIDNVSIIGSFGVIPKISFHFRDQYYSGIIPLYSTFMGGQYPIGDNVKIFVNPTRGDEVIVKKDGSVFVQCFFILGLYSMAVYCLI